MSQSAARASRRRNGSAPETIALPRELVQGILDYLARCPAGDVYPLLRALDEQLGIQGPRDRPAPAGTEPEGTARSA